jgi:hypothetical protein
MSNFNYPFHKPVHPCWICTSYYKTLLCSEHVTFSQYHPPVWLSPLPWRCFHGPYGHGDSRRGWTGSTVHTGPAFAPENRRERVVSISSNAGNEQSWVERITHSCNSCASIDDRLQNSGFLCVEQISITLHLYRRVGVFG